MKRKICEHEVVGRRKDTKENTSDDDDVLTGGIIWRYKIRQPIIASNRKKSPFKNTNRKQ